MQKITNRICIAAVILLFAGCKDYEMIKYGEGGEINFFGYDQYGRISDTEASLRDIFNFGVNERGDSLLERTVNLGARIMGNTADFDREILFKLEFEDGDDNRITLEKIEGENYFIPAGETQSQFSVLIKRPAKRNIVYKADIVFDYDKMSFIPGTYEQQRFKLEYSDVVNKGLLGVIDAWWNMYGEDWGCLFGWSETKARFIITHLGITDFTQWLGGDPFDVVLDCLDLQEILDDYMSDPSNPPLYDETKLPEEEWIMLFDYDFWF